MMKCIFQFHLENEDKSEVSMDDRKNCLSTIHSSMYETSIPDWLDTFDTTDEEDFHSSARITTKMNQDRWYVRMIEYLPLSIDPPHMSTR